MPSHHQPIPVLTLRRLLEQASNRLRPHSDSPRIEAELLLAHCLGKPRSHLIAWPDRQPDTQQSACFEQLLTQRLEGVPIAHLLGEREFWSLKLEVTPATLIPRPETELLVEQALLRIASDADMDIVDLGTGTGAIALAIATERPRCTITATDSSSAALDVAKKNAARLGLARIRFRCGDWYAPLADACFDMILSNPPYIQADDPHLDVGDVRFDPRSALVAGADGLDALRQIIAAAPEHLKPGGWLLVEHGYDQGDSVAALCRDTGLDAVTTYRDLAGQPRVTGGRKPF